MRIVQYLPRIRLEEGGVVRAVLNLTDELARAGHDAVLATGDDADVAKAWPEPARQARVRMLGKGGRAGGRLDPKQLAALEAVLDGADVLHLHAMWQLSNSQASRLATRKGVPFILSVHGMLDDWCMTQRTMKKKLYLSLLGRKMLHAAAFVHCTAQAELDQAKKWFPKGRGFVVPLICELEAYERAPGPEPAQRAFADVDWSRPTVLFLSRVHYKKAPEVLIKAVGILHRNGIECNLLFAGTGEDAYIAELQALAQREGVDARFLGFVTGETKISLLQAADLFALPTSQENFGFVFFESLAAGTPMVTTKGTDTWPELVESGATVLAEATPEAFAREMGVLLSDAPRRGEMGRRGRAWALEHLRPEQVVARYVDMYTQAGTRR